MWLWGNGTSARIFRVLQISVTRKCARQSMANAPGFEMTAGFHPFHLGTIFASNKKSPPKNTL